MLIAIQISRCSARQIRPRQLDPSAAAVHTARRVVLYSRNTCFQHSTNVAYESGNNFEQLHFLYRFVKMYGVPGRIDTRDAMINNQRDFTRAAPLIADDVAIW